MLANVIENFAEELSEILDVSVPVNMSQLVNSLNGEITYSKDIENKDSSIERTENTRAFRINVFPMKKKERRLELSHKLGHLFLHMGYLVDDEKWNQSSSYKDSSYYRIGHSVEEYEANLFAKAILLPKRDFFEIAKLNMSNEAYNVRNIASHFGVPEGLVKERGIDLGLFDISFQ